MAFVAMVTSLPLPSPPERSHCLLIGCGQGGRVPVRAELPRDALPLARAAEGLAAIGLSVNGLVYYWMAAFTGVQPEPPGCLEG